MKRQLERFGAGLVGVDSTVPIGIELMEEEVTALHLVELADLGCRSQKALHRPKKSAVGRVVPPHKTRTAPAARSEPIEASVITDAVCGIAFDRVASEATQLGPGIEEAGPTGHDVRNRGSPLVDVGNREGAAKRLETYLGFGVENSLRQAGTEGDWSIAHVPILAP